MTATAPSVWGRLRYTRLRDLLNGRIDGSLDWRQLIASADLPAKVCDTIVGVVRHTRLWRSEKYDVTQELIGHFQDGLEAGQSSGELVELFGDPGQAASLIRRAKKRGRPVAWQLWHFGWLSGAVLALVYLFTGVYMMLGRPTVKKDYLAIINEHAQAVPAAERAWPLYRDALLTMGAKFNDNNVNHPYVNACEAKPGEERWSEAMQFLTKNQDSIAEIRRASALPALGLAVGPSWQWFAPEDRTLFMTDSSQAIWQETTDREPLEDRWLISTLLPHLHFLRTTSELLHNDCLRAVAANDGEIALADITAILGMGRQLEKELFLVSMAIADAAQRLGLTAVREAFMQNPELWSEAQLRDLAHQVATAQVDWRHGFAGEAKCFDDVMQRMYTDDGQGDGRLAFRVSRDFNVFRMLDVITSTSPQPDSIWSNDVAAVLAMPAANLVVASRKEMTDVYRDFTNRAIVKIETPLWQQNEVPPEIELLTDHAGMIDRYRYLFLRILAPAHDQARNKMARSQGERDGILIGIALELFHREHGKWPHSLDELSPRWLPEVPVDRITGEPLYYKIVDDRPLVYSVGVDRDDDGGRIPQGENGAELASTMAFQLKPLTDDSHDGDWVIWSTAPTGGTSKVE